MGTEPTLVSTPLVVATGQLFADVVFGGLPSLPVLGQEISATTLAIVAGGGPAIVSVGLARLGVPTACCARVGKDEFGSMILTQLRAEGVSTQCVTVSDYETTNLTVELTFPEDRAFVTHRGLRTTLTDTEVLSAVDAWNPRIVFIGGLVVSPEVLLRARSAGIIVVLDIGWEIAAFRSGELLELLPLTSVFMPSEAEALKITRTCRPEQAIDRLLDKAETVVVKCGSRGAIGGDRQGIVESPAFDVTVVDTTGAGHAFDAGYIFGLLEGWPMLECLQAANACAAFSTTRYGAIAGLPDRTEWQSLMG
jgi:sugar/nucleoside kinase (ribokinase family)